MSIVIVLVPTWSLLARLVTRVRAGPLLYLPVQPVVTGDTSRETLTYRKRRQKGSNSSHTHQRVSNTTVILHIIYTSKCIFSYAVTARHKKATMAQTSSTSAVIYLKQ